MFLNRFKYNKTNFKAGGLIEDIRLRSEIPLMNVPNKFIAPKRVDSRDLCLSSSNQFQTPHCAGYSMAGYIEYHNWKTKHYPEQVDGDMIYFAAKQIDRNDNHGTTLLSAALGAINLHFIAGLPKDIDADDITNSIKFALHENGVCIAGFRITEDWNFVDNKNGMIRKSANSEGRGGHAVLLCGYDSDGVYIQNSWGETWGHYGFGILSWEQFKNQFMQAMIIT